MKLEVKWDKERIESIYRRGSRDRGGMGWGLAERLGAC
jgi:hypothetical protein